MILLLDNYDSFVYNLARYVRELGETPSVHRNDTLTVEDVSAMAPSHIIISPGPCSPSESGISTDVVRRLGATIPILGVCLGHQCIGHVFGGEVIRNERVMHGKTSMIHHDGRGIYRGLPNPFEATRYHSLVIKRETFDNPDFVVSAWTEEGEIMGVRHRAWPLHGVQFHPESFLTLEGPRLLANFVRMGAKPG
jgi:anthranilate synthase/aminodeoxychorismate synthase-like glutamine amidotransferase